MPSKEWRNNHKKACIGCGKLIHSISTWCAKCSAVTTGKRRAGIERGPYKTRVDKGIPHSKEWNKKVSESQKGSKGYNWKGGITPQNKAIRNSIDFRLWREAVFARDNYTCQKCLERGNNLHPHHIKNFADYPELRFAIDNGITFCEKCHLEFHKTYGRENNNERQIKIFLDITHFSDCPSADTFRKTESKNGNKN